jgi:BirA family biotin operon repressor/biotin-[acetyl-CoA-carboxylase] ligase
MTDESATEPSTLEHAVRRFDVKQFLTLLRSEGCVLGETFHYFESVSSTNDLAKQALRAGALAGSVFLADAQTAGRGRQGRTWYSPPGGGLWFSALVDGTRLPEPQCLTLLVGVALRRALAKYCTVAPKIKWPNDIEVQGKKLAGILVEADLGSPLLIVGVGVNLITEFGGTDLSTGIALKDVAVAGADSQQAGPTRENVLVEILRELASQLEQYPRAGLGSVVSELRTWDALYGSEIRVGTVPPEGGVSPDAGAAVANGVEGVARGFDDQGRLILQTQEGSVSLGSGSVERRSF